MNSPEDYYKRNIETIKRDSKKAKMSIGYVMQLCGIDCNQALQTMAFAINQGIIEKPSKDEFIYRLAKESKESDESRMLKEAMGYLSVMEGMSMGFQIPFSTDDCYFPSGLNDKVTTLLNEYYGEGKRPEEVGGEL